MEEVYIEGVPTINVTNCYEVILYDRDIDVKKYVYINPINKDLAKIKIWKGGDIQDINFQYSKISSLNRFFNFMSDSSLTIKYKIL